VKLWYPSVDRLAGRAFELRESLGSIQAQDLRVIRSERHRGCKGPWTLTVEGDRRRGPGKWSPKVACAKCGAEYKHEISEELEVLRGEIEIYPRRGAAESALAHQVDEWVRLRAVVFLCPKRWPTERWDFVLEAWRLWLHAQVGGYAAVAVYGRTYCAAFSGMWTEWKVRDRLLRAREVVTERALRRPQLIPSMRRTA
jgi:hypothetical protein